MCKCHSYNNETGSTPERILDWAPYFPEMAKNAERTDVCVDACIANEVERLWKAGILTVGSCCGHGMPERRSIVISDSYGHRADDARNLVGPKTKILYWKLGEHAAPSQPASNIDNRTLWDAITALDRHAVELSHHGSRKEAARYSESALKLRALAVNDAMRNGDKG
jgi:hypothetical protein